MTTVKIAVTLPPEQVDEARRAVEEGRASSVSAYVAEALARQARGDQLASVVAAMRADDGTPSEADYGWADRVLGLT